MSASMTSRERVIATARHRETDRVPVFIWLNAHTGVKLMARYKPSKKILWNAIARFLWNRFEKGGMAEAKEIWRLFPMMYDVHTFNWANVYATEFGSDMILASWATPWNYTTMSLEKGHVKMTDLFGVTRSLGHGIYPDAVGPAIDEISDLESYRFPDYEKESLYNIFRRYREDYPDVCVAAEVWGPQDFTATSLFGMEKFMVWLIDYPEEMKNFMSRWADHQIEVARRSVAAGADVVFIEDDYGYDNRPLISMKMWKEFTYPLLKRMVDAVHETGALAALHSCGYQMPFLEHYVEAGVDMLHAFQPKAGNDFGKAHAEFGDKLTFITGIDIQRGEAMSPAELKQDMVENYKAGGKKGGHVFGTSHEIQYTMPDGNVRMIFDTIKEIQAGEHDG